MRRHSRAGRHGGFTLLEVILALSLSTLLMAAVYAALHMQYQFSTAGRLEMERAQVVRAVLQRIESDLHSVVFRPPEPVAEDGSGLQAADDTGSTGSGSSGGTSGGSTGGTGDGTGASGGQTGGTAGAAAGTGQSGTSNATTSGTSTDAESSFTTATQGLVGDQTWIIVNVSKPSREMNLGVLPLPGVVRRSDLRTVQWFVGTSSGTTSAATAAGLSRREGDQMTMAAAGVDADPALTGGQTVLLAPEVAHLEFAYFDGSLWQPSWDSQILGRLPMAVRVTIGLPLPADDAPLSQQAAAPLELHSFVIALPVADPASLYQGL